MAKPAESKESAAVADAAPKTVLASGLRIPFVGGNWKCNGNTSKLNDLILGLNKIETKGIDAIVAPTPIYLSLVLSTLKTFKVCAQNVSATDTGAYTGEIAPEQLIDIGIKYTIIGHSERRKYYGETNDVVTAKVKNALKGGLNVIACFGEELKQREDGKVMDVCSKQIKAIFDGIDIAKGQDKSVVLAYEPVWAIGTGKACDPKTAQETIAALRKFINDKISADVAKTMRIIYGGSVKPKKL
eukprot:CAMPEP_0114657598 /NCGR_PEP_ID=MMETSP0191-20121206/14202_1 /TAXON_ID=126664 /ORGANISM="Sorites sp." /LENGTH=242 /DNA_ID=CAMNT_0001877369 /DNA_START=51 /DNA_END=779 /DNA_ORIENTATION=+